MSQLLQLSSFLEANILIEYCGGWDPAFEAHFKMLRSLLEQQFPRIVIKGVADAENTGNFIVQDQKDMELLSPYGFLSTTERQSKLLKRIYEKYEK